MFKSDDKKEEKSKKIANWLGKTDIHKTHRRPINANDAIEKDLKIELLEDDQKFQELVLSVFHSVIVTFESSTCTKFIENHKGIGTFVKYLLPQK